MKQLKICLAGAMLFISMAAFSQEKQKIPPPPPPEMRHNNLAPPPPPKIKEGHPWTRNGRDVWVAKITKPTIPPNPPPPPPPPKAVDVEKPSLPEKMQEAIPVVPQKPAIKVMPPPPPPVPAKKEKE